jgi:protein-S-isoprenylcysteine O-methyltransferase Ste14
VGHLAIYEIASDSRALSGCVLNAPPATIAIVTVLRYAGWIAAIIYATIPLYWIVVHPRASGWGKRHSAPLKRLGLVWVAMWVAAFAVTFRGRDLLMYDTAWSWLAALPFFALGMFVYSRAKRGFTPDQLLGRAELQPEKHEQRLVTGGIRERVRHPIYLGHLLELIGWTVGTGMVVVLSLLMFAVFTGVVMIKMEDEELEQRFGEQYRQYRERVPAIVPRIL